MLDTLSGLLVGAFLLTVAVRGKSSDMVALAKEDRAFLQWAIAVGILLWLYNVPELRGILGTLIAAAFIGLFLTKGPTIAAQASAFWKSIGK